MPSLDRVVGGLRCRDVLDLLADYVDGELEQATLDRVKAHLGGCDTCEKFGGEYATLVAQLRAGRRRPQVSRGVRDRLSEHMLRFWTEEHR